MSYCFNRIKMEFEEYMKLLDECIEGVDLESYFENKDKYQIVEVCGVEFQYDIEKDVEMLKELLKFAMNVVVDNNGRPYVTNKILYVSKWTVHLCSDMTMLLSK